MLRSKILSESIRMWKPINQYLRFFFLLPRGPYFASLEAKAIWKWSDFFKSFKYENGWENRMDGKMVL